MDNLAEKVDVCPLNWVLFVYSWECEKCSLYEEVAAGCPLFRGFLIYQNLRSNIHFQYCPCYIRIHCWAVSLKRGFTIISDIRRVSVIAHMFCIYRTHWHYDQSTEITSQLHHGKL